MLHSDAEHAITFGRRALAELGEGEWLLESITAGTWLGPSGCAADSHRPGARCRRP
jgi:hypothetical protein